ncbi:MAG: 2-hydroxyglutaryl-CoA dehydratase [Syntrophomonadaceae bacterium]|nr:2-hydroxyglutaryl-CoA dehydratase [Syntrophomonadaceae bacterium]
MQYYLGVDIGSVSSNFVLLDEKLKLQEKVYMRTNGNPVEAIKKGYYKISNNMTSDKLIRGVGCTGSGRTLASILLGADIVKNEITAHGIAASYLYPGVRTIIEIGGQDSKLIILKDEVIQDFAMNTVCAAGTGSFIDQQAARLNIPISDFGDTAATSSQAVRIAGRCGVFAESDMIHKQQMGYPVSDILMGLCEALVRNYLNNLGKGKKIEAPIVFQGGVAANKGIKLAFEKILKMPVDVPEYYNVMGAVGVAILAKEAVSKSGKTNFRGHNFIQTGDFASNSFECKGCPNYCEVAMIKRDGKVLAYSGDKCGKWETTLHNLAVV